MPTTIKVNGIERAVGVDGDTPLLWVLRDVLGMTGTKFGCGMALCGACTVHVDGVATRSCITPIDGIGTSEIMTIEAIGTTPAGAKIQKAWLDCEVPQCGYCQSGQIIFEYLASQAACLDPSPSANGLSRRRFRKRSYSNQRVVLYRSARHGGAAGFRQGSASGDQPRPLQQRAVRDAPQFRSRFHTAMGHPCR